jgi:hypothetical protein
MHVKARKMSGLPISIFISYSRTDTAFVDLLEADLQAHHFQTWVDRRKLEGGQEWLEVLQESIERCHVLLLVLSPEAVASRNVRIEYRHALRQGKVLIPLEYQYCSRVPMDLNGIQWIDFKRAYSLGLNDLLNALSHIAPSALEPSTSPSTQLTLATEDEEPELVIPQPAPSPPVVSLKEKEKKGTAARAESGREHPALLRQQLLDRDPNAKEETPVSQQKELTEKLPSFGVPRLHQKIKQASTIAFGNKLSMFPRWRAMVFIVFALLMIAGIVLLYPAVIGLRAKPGTSPTATAIANLHATVTVAAQEYATSTATGLMLGFDAAHTHWNPYEQVINSTNVSRLELDWTYTTGRQVTSSPVVANGLVYIGSTGGELYAFDASCRSACSPLWTYTTSDAIISSPAITNGIVYVGSRDDKLYAFGLPG